LVRAKDARAGTYKKWLATSNFSAKETRQLEANNSQKPVGRINLSSVTSDKEKGGALEKLERRTRSSKEASTRKGDLKVSEISIRDMKERTNIFEKEKSGELHGMGEKTHFRRGRKINGQLIQMGGGGVLTFGKKDQRSLGLLQG